MRLSRLYSFTVAISLVLAVPAGAQEAPATQIAVPTEMTPWTHLEMNNDPDNFQFAIVTDRTGGHRAGVFMDGVRKLNLLQPEFVMSVGDLIEGYTENREQLAREWDEFLGFVDQLEMPFFFVPGNHDITNNVMAEEWEKRFGRAYYHFLYKGALFLCLNTQDPNVFSISEAQVEYVRNALDEHTDVRWTLVFMHAPMWNYGGDNNFAQIMALLAERPHSVFAGHTHHYYKHRRNDNDYIVLATMGGGSDLRGPNFGEFDHFMWVTMTDAGPRIANLMLGGIWDSHIVTEERTALVRAALSGATVRNEPVVADGPTFDGARTHLRLTNVTNVPMEVELRFVHNAQLRANRATMQRRVEPNNVDLVPVRLAVTTPTDPVLLPPLVTRWTVRYALEGEVNPVTIEGQHRINVDTSYAILPGDGIGVDGDLGDWPHLQVQPPEPGHVDDTMDAWYGPQDASFDFGVAERDGTLYVAVATVDDQQRLDPRGDFQDQDNITVYIDARPEDAQTGGLAQRDYLVVRMVATRDGVQLFRPDGLPDGIAVASVEERERAYYELAVPEAWLNAQAGGAWQQVRINVRQYDVDPGTEAAVWWRPDWDSPASHADSGRFFR